MADLGGSETQEDGNERTAGMAARILGALVVPVDAAALGTGYSASAADGNRPDVGS